MLVIQKSVYLQAAKVMDNDKAPRSCRLRQLRGASCLFPQNLYADEVHQVVFGEAEGGEAGLSVADQLQFLHTVA